MAPKKEAAKKEAAKVTGKAKAKGKAKGKAKAAASIEVAAASADGCGKEDVKMKELEGTLAIPLDVPIETAEELKPASGSSDPCHKNEASEDIQEGLKGEVTEEAKEEAKEKAKEGGKEEFKEEAKEKATVKTKQDVNEEAKEEATEGAKAEAKEEAKDEATEENKREAEEEALEDAKEEEGMDGGGAFIDPEEPNGEHEADAPTDARKKITGKVGFNMLEATPNAMPTVDGRLLMALGDGGLQYLMAGVKATVGMKSGRYMFELKVVELLNPVQNIPMPPPKHFVRMGFCLAESSGLLADSATNVFFDSDGYFVHELVYERLVHLRVKRNCVMAALLNLDEKSPNKNTVSFFCDGKLVAPPQKLPESLIGKTLFPAISYTNVTLHVNFGLAPLKPLPFQCRMLQDAAEADVEIVDQLMARKTEVIFPVGLPDHGLFDWLDMYLEANPKYFELSDRKILEWAKKSGNFRPGGYDATESQDKPGMNFGIPCMDDQSIQKSLAVLASAMSRPLVSMEIQANLLADKRKDALRRFPTSTFKRVAVVVMGEPPSEYKMRTQKLILADKVRNAKVAAARKGKGKGEGTRRATREGQTIADDEAGENADDKAEETPVSLTDDERALWHRTMERPDIAQAVLASSYAKFSLPVEEEGFDEIRYVWQDAGKSAASFTEWIREQKKTQRVDDLEPSAWFKVRLEAWQTALADWRKRQSTAKKSSSKKKVDADKVAEDDIADDEKGTSDAKEADEDDVDVFALEDINNMGNGLPLYALFEHEDWVLVSLRYELHLLVHAFRHDLDDPDRPSFPESQLGFYYNKYYGKGFRVGQFGCNTFAELVDLVKEGIGVAASTGFIQATWPIGTPLEKFVRCAEEARRERQRCVDAGDETARLNFVRPRESYARVGPRYSRDAGKGGKGGGGGGYGGAAGGKGSAGRHGRAPPLVQPHGSFRSAAPLAQGLLKRQYPATAPTASYPPLKYPRYAGRVAPPRGSYGGGRR